MIEIFKLRARSFYAYLCRSVGLSVGRSVCLSLEKMSKIVKNHEFGLHLITKVVDLLEYTQYIYSGLVCVFLYVRLWV